MKMRSLALLLLALGVLHGATASAQLTPGWSRVDLDQQSTYYDYYVPGGLAAGAKVPVIVFLHRAGMEPMDYREALQGAADAAGAVLALPRSESHFGWGFTSDAGIINAAVEHLGGVVEINEFRLALAGHGDGVRFALERALDPATAYSAVFGVGASSSSLPAAAELEHLPPVRLYYGANDENRTQYLEPLRAGLEGRGIAVQVEVLAGNGADDLPAAAMAAGFEFLVAQSLGGQITQFGCENGEETICLTGGRFRVSVDWETAEGGTGSGKVADLRSDGSGLFWFFNAKNWELLVKVLDGCDLNQHFWVFMAASTNLEYTLTVEDMLAQTSVVYTNPQGRAAPAINDTSALETCDATAE
jgi:nucleotide-binding universal stress UspA family protein